MEVLGGGRFLMSEVPLYLGLLFGNSLRSPHSSHIRSASRAGYVCKVTHTSPCVKSLTILLL
jgi:hypothetical protein